MHFFSKDLQAFTASLYSCSTNKSIILEHLVSFACNRLKRRKGRKAFLVTKGREERFLLSISNFSLNFCLSSFFKSSFIYRSSEPWPALKSNSGCEKLTLVILSMEDTIHFSWIVTLKARKFVKTQELFRPSN